MFDITKFPLHTRHLLICLFILIAGLSAGIFFAGILPAADASQLISILSVASGAPFIIRVLTNLFFLLLIGIAGFTIYGFPLAPVLLWAHSFAVGFCDCLLLYSTGSESIFHFIFTFLLPQLVICGIYTITAAASISYALLQLHK